MLVGNRSLVSLVTRARELGEPVKRKNKLLIMPITHAKISPGVGGLEGTDVWPAGAFSCLH